MKIVIKDRRYTTASHEAWRVVYEIEGKSIDASLVLTSQSIKHWLEDKSPLGYASMRDLRLDDIKSIISCAKRGECHLNIERWGRVFCYKLNDGNRSSL